MDYGNALKSPYVGQAAPGLMPTPEDSKIRDEVTQAENLLSDIHGAIEAMERRLDTVVRPAPPTPTASQSATGQPVMSHLLGRLRLLNEGYTHAIARLNDLRGRIEV